MKPNLWIYSTPEIINRTAASLVVFGAEIFHRAKIIRELDSLESITKGLDNKSIQPNNEELSEFIFSHLLDTICILIFFENYMKAELMIKGFCVHQLNSYIPGFKEIARRQFSEPILMKDINSIEPFEINKEKENIFHRGIKETTIGLKELIGSKEYLCHYQFSEEVLNFIKEATIFRNKLHFHDSIEFYTSMEKISTLKNLKAFVDETMGKVIHSAHPKAEPTTELEGLTS